MKTKITLILFLVTTFECYGHLSILGDIISSARDRIHSNVDNVAGALLGGISHGFNLNIGGHVGFQGREPPHPPPSRDSDETIVVVVEESNDNNYRPPNTNNFRPNHQDHRPPNHEDRRPPYYNQQGPHTQPGPGYEHQFQRPNQQNEYDNHNQHNENQEGGNNNYGIDNQHEHTSYQQPDNDYNNYNHYNHNNNNNNNHNNNNHNNNNNGNDNEVIEDYSRRPYQHQDNTNDQGSYNDASTNNYKPSTEYITESTQFTPSSKDSGTENFSEDVPLFVPLNPNEYVYGGDRINITAPKRDTEKTNQAESEDEDLGIDVRFNKKD